MALSQEEQVASKLRENPPRILFAIIKSELIEASGPGSLTYNGLPGGNGGLTANQQVISHPGTKLFQNKSVNDTKFPVPGLTQIKLRIGSSKYERALVQTIAVQMTEIA